MKGGVKGAKGKEWRCCLYERCDCRSLLHSPNSMHLDSGLRFSADMMSLDALGALLCVSYRWTNRTELFLQLSLNPMGYMQEYLSLKVTQASERQLYTQCLTCQTGVGGTEIATGEKSAGYTDKNKNFKQKMQHSKYSDDSVNAHPKIL